jgi:putative phosphoesterase
VAGEDRQEPIVVGVVSDTHGHLYPRVRQLLKGVNHIIHAGDVGSPEVLKGLRSIAPVIAVRGNVDVERWAEALPSHAEADLGGVRFIVEHVAPRTVADNPGQAQVVVSGHSHIAALEQRAEVLYLNPGSAGPRRFGRPRTIALLEICPPAADRPDAGPTATPRVTAQILSAEDD